MSISSDAEEESFQFRAASFVPMIAASATSVDALLPEWLIKKPVELEEITVITKMADVPDGRPITPPAAPSPSAQTVQWQGPVISSSIDMHADEYKMDHEFRGRAVIFNHETFSVNMSKREGTQFDVDRLKTTFSKLEFDVQVYNDLKMTDVLQTINKLKNEDHSKNDCLAVVLLTHGIQGDLLAAYDAFYPMETLWNPFAANECPTLATKPKLFFIQACRGSKLDSGITVTSMRSLNSETDSAAQSYKIPNYSDFLIAFSSFEGHSSWRSPDRGTWFIECLCSVLETEFQTTDLLRMLTKVSRKVAIEYESFNDINALEHQMKQIPSISSMLIRDIYFKPKNSAGITIHSSPLSPLLEYVDM